MSTFLCKAHSGNLNQDYTGWLWSRKLNGFSMLWDGGISTGKPLGQITWGKQRAREDGYTPCTGLWTSDGHIIHAPKWWYQNFPKYVPLQGECWYNDNKWYASACNSTLMNNLYDPRWKKLKFMVYNYKPYCLFYGLDKEILPEENKIYYQNDVLLGFRLIALTTLFLEKLVKSDKGIFPLDLVDHNDIDNDFNLGKFLYEKTAGENSWEGIMVTNPKGLYKCDRTWDLLKFKPEYDIEVEVMEYIEGQKRHTGRMGSLVVKLIWDEKVLSFHGGKKDFVNKKVYFNVGGGFTDAQREWNFVQEVFPLGKIITINFSEVGSNGAIPSARWNGIL